MDVQTDHRTRAEDALANAQRNPVMSAEQSFLGAIVHALLALEHRLEDVVVGLRDARSFRVPVDARVVSKQNGKTAHEGVGNTDKMHPDLQYELDRAADDGWPHATSHDDLMDVFVDDTVAVLPQTAR